VLELGRRAAAGPVADPDWQPDREQAIRGHHLGHWADGGRAAEAPPEV